MAKEFASLGIIEVDGLEIDLTKCDVRVITGRKPVKTINRKARVKGFAKGITEYTLSLTVAVPLNSQNQTGIMSMTLKSQSKKKTVSVFRIAIVLRRKLGQAIPSIMKKCVIFKW
ncbi:hypothetical protein [Pasteurella multocida]|uniref:hypothetical protein n=1 Tax=Pasteurella multocida TaxID=747 RepID=UPI002E32D806|nr:hypothetical protein [Pasteurella multocida]